MDTAIYPGYTIPPYYDSMIVKIIAYDRDRMSAIRKMISVLGEFRIKGVTTKSGFPLRCAESSGFPERHVSVQTS